jgi:Cu/Ag efflux protein CusF
MEKERVMRKHLRRLVGAAGLALLVAAACLGQAAPAKKAFTFHGKVQAVSADGLTVDGEKVDGWMDAMTMKYKVDDPKVLKTVKPGDKIKATVYEGEFTSLHKVEVDGKSGK